MNFKLLLIPSWGSLLFLGWFSLGWHGSRAEDYALQTGPDSRGSTYGGGLVYNPHTNLIYVTGATYGRFFQNDFDALNVTNNSPTSACFLGMVTGPSDNPKILPQWLFASTFESTESASANEECNSLSLLGDSRIFMAGSSSESGILASLRSPGGRRVQQYGMMLDVRLEYVHDANNRTVGAAASLAGGRLINKYNVQYPIAVVATNSNNNPIVNLVSLHTESKDNNTDFLQAYPNVGSPNSPQPDLTTGGSFQYGSKYRLFTAQYSAESLAGSLAESSTNRGLVETLSEDWFEATGVSTGESVYASATLLVNGFDRVLVAGYTRAGSGLNFPIGSKTAGDVNGFVATRYSTNGSYVDGVETALVQSTDGGDDYLEGMCQCDGTTPSNAFYVVGYTNGTFAKAILKPTKSLIVTAFVVKLDALTLDTIWVQQLAAPNLAAEVRGIACTVSNDNDVVYVAGNIKGNAAFDKQTAYGQDDVFVAQLATDNGNINYIRQMGSSANDRLARGGVVTDAKGNALILANTEGDWFRVRSSEESSGHAPYSDMVLLSVSKADGSFRAPGALPTMPPSPGAGGHGVGSAGGSVPPPRRMALMTLVIVAIVAMGIFAIVRITQQPNELVETDRTKVLAYLRDFDVEDIDLRHSATGGWHCTYASNPAEKEHYRYFGIGGEEDDDDEEDRRIQGRSGLIRDAAYVDPLHAPLAPINPLLGRSPAVRSPKSSSRSSPPEGGLMAQLSLLSEDSETKRSKRNRRRGGGSNNNHHHHQQQQQHGLMDEDNDSSRETLSGDLLPSASRNNKSSRSKHLTDESWGKEII